jgi:hypothetical protein
MSIYYLIQIDVGDISICEKHNIYIYISFYKLIYIFTARFNQHFHFKITAKPAFFQDSRTSNGKDSEAIQTRA